MTRAAAVLIAGPPATGKSTLAVALAPRLEAALLDLDTATGPLTRVVSELAGRRDLDDPVLAGLTRDARYDTLLGLAEDNLAAGRPVVLVAPFSAERARPRWAAVTRRLATEAVLVWLHLPPDELVRRLTGRALARDENKIRDPASYLTGLDLVPPGRSPTWPWTPPSRPPPWSGRCLTACPVSVAIDGKGCRQALPRWQISDNQCVPSMAKLETPMPHRPGTPPAAHPRADRPVSGSARLLDVANAAGVSLRTASPCSTTTRGSPRIPASASRRPCSTCASSQTRWPGRCARARTPRSASSWSPSRTRSSPRSSTRSNSMSRHGRSVLVTSTRRDRERERDVIGRMLQRRVAGLLLAPTGGDHSWLDAGRGPVVLVDRPRPACPPTSSRSTTIGPRSRPRLTSSVTATGASPTSATRPPSRPPPPGCAVIATRWPSTASRPTSAWSTATARPARPPRGQCRPCSARPARRPPS